MIFYKLNFMLYYLLNKLFGVEFYFKIDVNSRYFCEFYDYYNMLLKILK